MTVARAQLVYGRQGGRWLPDETREQAARRVAGLVRAACLCTLWWLIARQLGEPCGHCGEPMLRLPDPGGGGNFGGSAVTPARGSG